MRPTQHRSNTRVIGAPPHWDQEVLQCAPLAVTDRLVDGLPCLSSFWQPDAAEVAALTAGGSIMLTVFGTVMAPVMVEVVTNKPEPQPPTRERP